MMIMCALCICTGRPFDFRENDMLSIRKWWCVQLMERFSIEGHGQRFAFWTPEAVDLSQGGLEPLLRLPRRKISSKTLSDQPRTVQDLHLAVQWIHENPDVFRGELKIPTFHAMSNNEQKEAVRCLLEANDSGDNDDLISARHPFMFVFNYMEDMRVFLRECWDKRGLRVNAECVEADSK
ncbi:uncharacterized protein ACB058_000377 [Synchiropus picturatus]